MTLKIQPYIEKEKLKKEQQRLKEENDRKIIDEINKKISDVINTPSKLFRRLTTLSKKRELNDSEIKINKWNDKIKEFISELTYYEPTTSKNLSECIDKINIIIDIINEFILNPNTMIKSSIIKDDNNYNIQKNKIYNSFLNDYKNRLDNTDLQNPLYERLKEEYSNILIKLKNIKLDDCRNNHN